VQLNVKMLFYAMKHCHINAISPTGAEDAERDTVFYEMHVHVLVPFAEVLFQMILMTNETSMFPLSSCTPVKAEPILLGL